MVKFDEVAHGILPRGKHNARQNRMHRRFANPEESIHRQKRFLAFEVKIFRNRERRPIQRLLGAKPREPASVIHVHPIKRGIRPENMEVGRHHRIFHLDKSRLRKIITGSHPVQARTRRPGRLRKVAQKTVGQVEYGIGEHPGALAKAVLELESPAMQFLAPRIPGHLCRFRISWQREEVHHLLGNSQLDEEEQEDAKQVQPYNGDVTAA